MNGSKTRAMHLPQLPSRERRRANREDAGQAVDVLALQQQLLSHPVFQGMVDQPQKLAAVLQADPVLQQAAASNPQLAELLDPATMMQAVSLLQQQPGAAAANAATSAPANRRALMLLQNYAMQLSTARAAGRDVQLPGLQQQQQQPQQQQPQQPQQFEADPKRQDMWAALQQRMNKYQQRTQLLQAGELPGEPPAAWPEAPASAAAGMGKPSSINTPLNNMTGVSPAPTPAAAAAGAAVANGGAAAHQQPRASDGSGTLSELLMAFPDLMGAANGSHGTIQLMSAVSDTSASAAAAAAATAEAPWQQQQALQEQQQQQQQWNARSSNGRRRSSSSAAGGGGSSGGGSTLWPQAFGQGGGSDPSVGCSAASAPSAAPRCSSALGHRILRPQSSSPIPLGSGSQPLGIEQLGSGEVIVNITPPTRVTRELSWSLDPEADYVLDASASGSFSPLPVSTVAAGGTAALLLGASSEAQALAAAAAGAAAPGGGNGSGSSLPGSSSTSSISAAATAAAAGAPGAMSVSPWGPVWQGLLPAVHTKAGAAAAAAGAAAGGAAGGTRSARVSTCSSTGSGRAAGRTILPRGSYSGAEPQVPLWQQQQQALQEFQWQPAAAGAAPGAGDAAANDGSSSSAFQPFSPGRQQQHAYNGNGSLPQQQQNAAAAAGGRGGGLSAGSYYEDVAPSSWRPADAGPDYPADYLELYRRAYCSAADALFPPLWLGLMVALASSRVLPLWQLVLVGAASFWTGLYVMAVRWAGVPTSRLPLSRVTPVFVVCLELLCGGAFVLHVLPVMWLGHSAKCLAMLAALAATLGLHLSVHLQDPGYTPIPDTEEGPCARHLQAAAAKPSGLMLPAGTAGSDKSKPAAAAGTTGRQQQQQPAASFADIKAGRAAGDGAAAVPLLATQQQQQQQPYPVPKLAGRAVNSCWSCGVERNLRSKHCPICKRCVERFDHHCPVVGNCIGAGNHRSFVSYLLVLVLCQLLFCQLLGGMMVQQYTQQRVAADGAAAAAAALGLLPQPTAGMVAAAGVGAAAASLGAVAVAGANPQPVADGAAAAAGTAAAAVGEAAAAAADPSSAMAAGPVVPDAAVSGGGASGGSSSVAAAELEVLRTGASSWSFQAWWATAKALAAAASSNAGLFLLLLLQVPTMVISLSLLTRALALAAANLTVNEWINRQRFLYLQHEAAGFCNRFDRGPIHNCAEFWAGPVLVDWWALWQSGEQEMRSSGRSVLVPGSATLLVRLWERTWSRYRARLMAARERRRERQLERRMRALGLQPQQGQA